MPPAIPGERRLFPDLKPAVYANHASVSPPSLPVRQVVQAVMDGYAREGMGWYVHEMARREQLRDSLSALIGAESGTIGLVPNTTGGMLAVAHGLRWEAGDRILVFDGEFPTNVTPWQQAASRHGLELVWMRADDFRTDRDGAMARLEQQLKQRVRLVAVSAVQFSTGQRMPLAAMSRLCRQYGAELFVDAIQAVGIVPLDVNELGIDYLACGSHKWLMAPEGIGFLYVAPQCAGQLDPNVAGWLSHEDAFAFLSRAPGELRYDRPFQAGARMAEAGTPNCLGAAGLAASVEILTSIGIDAIYRHVQAWHDAVEPGLVERGFESARMRNPEGRSGILSIRPSDPATAPDWVASLGEHGIACASPDGWIRFSPHWPNGMDECGILLTALDAIAAG